jgi:hypothetical protein
MTGDAGIVECVAMFPGIGTLNLPVSMTLQAPITVMGGFLIGIGDAVRVVAGDAAQFLSALDRALAGLHLFDLADDRRPPFLDSRRFEKHNPIVAQRHSRSKIEFCSSVTDNPAAALEVTLVADGLATCRFKLCRIANGISAGGLASGRLVGNVIFPRAVAAFAANRFFRKRVRSEPMRFIVKSVDAPGVAGQTSFGYTAIEAAIEFERVTW